MKTSVRVLIVEDEAITAMLMRVTLTKLGYDVCDSVSTGEAAVTAAKKHSPDLVLMDIRLAGKMDGIEAASIIKSDYNIAIIFTTGYDTPEMKEKALKTAPLDYLIKPISPEKLEVTIIKYFHS